MVYALLTLHADHPRVTRCVEGGVPLEWHPHMQPYDRLLLCQVLPPAPAPAPPDGNAVVRVALAAVHDRSGIETWRWLPRDAPSPSLPTMELIATDASGVLVSRACQHHAHLQPLVTAVRAVVSRGVVHARGVSPEGLARAQLWSEATLQAFMHGVVEQNDFVAVGGGDAPLVSIDVVASHVYGDKEGVGTVALRVDDWDVIHTKFRHAKHDVTELSTFAMLERVCVPGARGRVFVQRELARVVNERLVATGKTYRVPPVTPPRVRRRRGDKMKFGELRKLANSLCERG